MKKLFTMLALLLTVQASAQLSTHNWSHRMGGTNSDESTAIVTDNAGNSYTAGHFQGTFTVGTATLTSVGSRDIFLIKRNSSGSVVFVKQFGGTGNDYCRNIEFDNFGSIYLVGDFTVRSLRIYPNPAQTAIEIGIETGKIQIRNLQGALLLEVTNTKTIDVANLANGIYIIYATDKDQQYIGKFVKQ